MKKNSKILMIVIVLIIIILGLFSIKNDSGIFRNNIKNIPDKNIQNVVNKNNKNEKKPPEELIEGGKVWLVFDKKEIKAGEEVDVKVYLDSAGENLGVFRMDFNFDPNQVNINTAQGNDGFGIDAGVDLTDVGGIASADYTVDVNANDISNGHYRFAGIPGDTNMDSDPGTAGDQENYAHGNNIHLVTIHLKVLNSLKNSFEEKPLKVLELSNQIGHMFDVEKINEYILIK